MLCSMCGGSARTPNYAKLVDPYPPPYGTILGDEPPKCKKSYGGSLGPIQVCLPTFACPQPMNYGTHNPGQQPAVVNIPCDRICSPYNGVPPQSPARHNPGQQPCIVNVPRDCVKECPKIICEPCPPPPPTKVWLIKSSPMPQKVGLSSLLLFLLSFAIAQPPPCIPICNQPIFIPCQRPC